MTLTSIAHRRCSLCGHDLKAAAASWEFTLPLEPPSQNVVAGNQGSGRWGYAKIRNSFEVLLVNRRTLMGIPAAKTKRRVLITRLYSGHGQVRDIGNIIGGCKPLLDAMTRARLIVDDGPHYVEVHYFQERTKESGVTICIEEL